MPSKSWGASNDSGYTAVITPTVAGSVRLTVQEHRTVASLRLDRKSMIRLRDFLNDWLDDGD